MRIIILHFVLFIIHYSFCTAQQNGKEHIWEGGYYITSENDTVRGLIKFKVDQSRSIIVVFEKTDIHDKYRLEPSTIKGFRKQDRIFESIETESGDEFMEVIVYGGLTLYHHIKYYLPDPGPANFLITQQEYVTMYLRKKIVCINVVPKAGFRKQMSIYFSDYPELANKIYTKKLKYDDMKEIVDIYNKKFDGIGK